MKVVDIVNAEPVLVKISEATGLPISLSYNLIPVMREAGEVSSLFDTRRVEAIKRLGDTHEDGSTSVPTENQAEFETTIRGYLDEEIDFPQTTIQIKELEPHVQLSLVEVSHIEWLLEA